MADIHTADAMTTSTRRLANIIADHKSVIIIDARSFSDYNRGHIPGAINLDLFSFHWNDTTYDGICNFERQTARLFSFAGISKDKAVIFYDEKSGMLAARGVWMLLYMSHDDVCMLDGGFAKWRDESRPIETKMHEFEPTEFKSSSDSSIIASHKYVAENLDRLVIIDARSPAEYNGDVIRAARAGHIPGAINIEWRHNLIDVADSAASAVGQFKNNVQLAELYKDIPHDSEIITYCHGAYRAANSFLALRKAGFKNVRIYLGSWGEWGNLPNLPVE